MKTAKRLLLGTLLAVLLCAFPLRTDADGLTISVVGNPIDPAWKEILLLSPGQDIRTLALPASYTCGVVYGRRALGYACPVTWDLYSLNPNVSGLQYISGTLTPNTGYALDPSLSAQVSWPVYVDNAAPAGSLTMMRAENNPDSSIILAADTLEDVSARLNAEKTIRCYTAAFGEYLDVDAVWDLSGLNLSVPGLYTVTAVPALPQGMAMDESWTPLTQQICVVKSDRIDLSAAQYVESDATVVCQWLYAPQDPNSLVLEYSCGDGLWMQDTPDGSLRWYYGCCLNGGTQLSIFLDRLTIGQDYYFRLRYDDQVSNVVRVRTDAVLSPVVVGGLTGDRDGGDSGNGTPAPITVPNPGTSNSGTEPTITSPSAPTSSPTSEPTASPAAAPTAAPIAAPIAAPTAEPTASPAAEPTAEPAAAVAAAMAPAEAALVPAENGLFSRRSAAVTAAAPTAAPKAAASPQPTTTGSVDLPAEESPAASTPSVSPSPGREKAMLFFWAALPFAALAAAGAIYLRRHRS